MKLIVSTVFAMFLFTIHGNAQSKNQAAQIEKLIDKFEKADQNCVDVGTNNFVDCENLLYKRIDSLLNVVYKELKNQMDPAQFQQLRKEQIAWIKKRDKYAGDQVDEISKDHDDAGPEADQALAIRRKTSFVEDRVKELLKGLK